MLRNAKYAQAQDKVACLFSRVTFRDFRLLLTRFRRSVSKWASEQPEIKIVGNGLATTFYYHVCMYDRVVSAVKVKSGLTATFTPLVGVRQGCNLSPTLFNILVNDIVDIFDSTCDPLIMGEYKINVYYMQMILSCLSNQNIVCRNALIG